MLLGSSAATLFSAVTLYYLFSPIFVKSVTLRKTVVCSCIWFQFCVDLIESRVHSEYPILCKLRLLANQVAARWTNLVTVR